METTPRSTRSSSRYRRTPTPRLSERKKKLFDDVLKNGDSPTMRNPYVRLERIIVEEADDSDIGPMSPLEFSSSPSSFNELHRIIVREPNGTTKMKRTNFSNILNEVTDDETKTRSQRMTKKTNSADSDVTKEICEEDVVGPLCTSMKKLNSMIEQNYEQQMKTPSEMTTSGKSVSEPAARGASFRKSLIFDTGLTPHVDQLNASSAIKSNDHDSGERPKAKTSLTFTEPTISVRSFYGKSAEKTEVPEPNNKDDNSVVNINTHEIAVALAMQKIKSKSKSKPKSKSKSASLAKRMKAPSLWRFSGKMKFNRHKWQRSQKLSKKKEVNTSTSRKNTSENKSFDSKVNVENIAPSPGVEFTSRIEQNLRLQKILKDQTNALNVSREINWTGGTKSMESTPNHAGFLNSDGEDDDEDDGNSSQVPKSFNTYEEVEVEVEEPTEPTNRKFFKSSASNSAKKYRIMGRLSATVKRGGDLKFDPPPKRKKKRSNKGEEIVVLHNEITSIIDRLTSPSKEKASTHSDSDCENEAENTVTVSGIPEKSSQEIVSESPNMQPDFIQTMQTELNDRIENTLFITDVEKYRRIIPYNTNDPEKISQQESILELLISNGICDDETFKIFIAEPDLHKEKASQILDSLYCVNTMMPNEYDNEAGAIEWVNSVESVSIVQSTEINPIEANANLGSKINVNSAAPSNLTPTTNIIESESSNTTVEMPDPQTTVAKLFPIFSKNFFPKDTRPTTFNALDKTAKEWVPIGNQQYQLDVGQKEFGLRTCPQCEMQYSVHEPEDELLHIKYHNCVNILAFKGWNNERMVTQIPDWGLNGRVIYVCEADSKAKKERVKEVLDMVDRDLGFAARTELKPKTLVYFAIAKQQIVGVCVVQPLERAHRLKTENGVDCATIETFPVKCGISRIWVAPQYRRHGIAAKLITSMRSHFLFGAFLSFDEIAFSSPTEDGKRFAASLAQRSDFLIYES